MLKRPWRPWVGTGERSVPRIRRQRFKLGEAVSLPTNIQSCFRTLPNHLTRPRGTGKNLPAVSKVMHKSTVTNEER